jgi:hypothetical protein
MVAPGKASPQAAPGVNEAKSSLTFRLRRASAASISVLCAVDSVPTSNAFVMDVQTDIVEDFLRGCLVPFIDDESGASHASLIADRSPH